jgi:hypothetical protein
VMINSKYSYQRLELLQVSVSIVHIALRDQALILSHHLQTMNLTEVLIQTEQEVSTEG